MSSEDTNGTPSSNHYCEGSGYSRTLSEQLTVDRSMGSRSRYQEEKGGVYPENYITVQISIDVFTAQLEEAVNTPYAQDTPDSSNYICVNILFSQ